MKRIVPPLLVASLGLGGCVAVPAYDAPPYGYAPAAVYVTPAPVVVRPYVYGGAWVGRPGYYGRPGYSGHRWR